MNEQDSSLGNTVFYGVAWIIACVLLILALLNAFELVKDALNWIATYIEDGNKHWEFLWTIGAITQGMFFIGGCLAVGLAIGVEYYFRMGVKNGLLLKRVIKVFVIEVSVIVVSILIRVIVPAIIY